MLDVYVCFAERPWLVADMEQHDACSETCASQMRPRSQSYMWVEIMPLVHAVVVVVVVVVVIVRRLRQNWAGCSGSLSLSRETYTIFILHKPSTSTSGLLHRGRGGAGLAVFVRSCCPFEFENGGEDNDNK